MKKAFFLFCVAMFMTSWTFGQSSYRFEPSPQSSFYTNQPDTLGQREYQLSDSVWVAANGYWKYLVVGHTALLMDDLGFIDTIETFDFNGDGVLDYMVYREVRSGHGSWDHGWEENYRLLAVYDLENSYLLLAKTLYFEHREWDVKVADEPDSIPGWERDVLESDYSYDCEEQLVTLDRNTGLLCFKLVKESRCEEETTFTPVPFKPACLKWTEKGFVKVLMPEK